MPQLDPSTFATQLVWLIITFLILYLILWKSALPRIASILQDRQERIDDDLEKAEKLKKEAEIALEDYQKIVSDGRSKAQEIVREASQKLAIETTQRQNSLTERLAKRATEAETRIQNAKNEALKNIESVVSDIAQATAHRLTGLQISKTESDFAVSKISVEQNK